MDRPRQLLLGLCAALISTVAGAQTAVTRVLTRDTFSYAQYFQTSPDGCESSSLEVFASKSMTRYSHNLTIYMPLVRTQLFSFNYCTQVLSFMSGVDEAPTIDVKPDLTRATVSATVVMMDEFSNIKTVQLSLTWSGGELSTDKTRLVFTSPYSRTMIRAMGSIRNSTSITGTLVLDGVDLLAPTNPAQSRFILGYVTSSKGVSIDLVRTP